MTSPVFKQIRVYDPPVELAPAPTGSALPDASLQLWLRSENIPTGSKWITSWPDASGKANNAKRLVKTNFRITWDTTTIGNGHRSMSWGGKGESRLALPSTFKLTQYGTLVAVYRVSGNGLVGSWWDRGQAAGQAFRWRDDQSAGGVDAPVGRIAPHAAVGTTTRVVMVTASATGWVVRSAAQVAATADTTGFAVPSLSRMVLGGTYSDNQNQSAAETYSGALAEFLFYSTAFADTRQTSIVQELCTKFGVPYA